jgi:hypothetical protein
MRNEIGHEDDPEPLITDHAYSEVESATNYCAWRPRVGADACGRPRKAHAWASVADDKPFTWADLEAVAREWSTSDEAITFSEAIAKAKERAK